MAANNDHVAVLRTALEQQIKARRDLATALGQPYKGGHTEKVREGFVQVQATIEAIERALVHEEKMAGKQITEPGVNIVVVRDDK